MAVYQLINLYGKPSSGKLGAVVYNLSWQMVHLLDSQQPSLGM